MEKNLENIIGYIYKLTSPNGKIYVGQTLNPIKRKSDYKHNNFKQQIKLLHSCECYNWSPHETFEIIEQCLCGKNKETLNEREIFWINFYDSFHNGLNCNEGGNGNIGHKHTNITKEKMRKAKLGVKHSPERNAKKSEYRKGRKHTEESKKLMSENKKKNMNSDVKDRIRQGLIGNKNGIGNKAHSVKILCVNNNKIYNSIKEASIELKLTQLNISKTCKGIIENTKGYKFKYYEKTSNT